jgi:hypothetical protein
MTGSEWEAELVLWVGVMGQIRSGKGLKMTEPKRIAKLR